MRNAYWEQPGELPFNHLESFASLDTRILGDWLEL